MRDQIESLMEALARCWTGALREEMEPRLPPPFSLDPADASAPHPPAGVVWFRQEFSAGLSLLIGTSRSILVAVNQTEGSTDAFPEPLRAGLSLCANQLESRFGMSEAGEIASTDAPASLRSIAGDRLRWAGSEGTVWLAMEEASYAILEQVSTIGARPLSTSPQLDVLMGLELPVSISFGGVDMPLSDVLSLAPGSIVELNHRLNEPVDVMVNSTLVAQGQVVVVDGNYGVRVSKVFSRPLAH